ELKQGIKEEEKWKLIEKEKRNVIRKKSRSIRDLLDAGRGGKRRRCAGESGLPVARHFGAFAGEFGRHERNGNGKSYESAGRNGSGSDDGRRYRRHAGRARRYRVAGG